MTRSAHLPPATPPKDIAELKSRAHRLAGLTIGQLAAWAEVTAPVDLRRSKGFVGQLLEHWLGARAGNQALPDFTHLGVELKTLPVDNNGKPLESTYVTMVPLRDLENLDWRSSKVYAKLRHVMWVPVQAGREVALAERVVGQAFMWQPSTEEEELLCADWEFHIGRIREGEVEEIRGRDGAVLQVRPKAPHSETMTVAELPQQRAMPTKPCGFYLRPGFTSYLIQRYFFDAGPQDPAQPTARSRADS